MGDQHTGEDAAREPEGPEGPGRAERRRMQKRRRRRRVVVGSVTALALLLVAVGGFAWWAYDRLNGNIKSEDFASKLEDKERPLPTEATNVLLIGSDSRAGANSDYGGAEDSERSDTVILLHVPQGRKTAIAVSFPRDLMTDIPACALPGGGTSRAGFGMFNTAYETGGAACTIKTVEKLTGARVDHQVTVDFTGFKGVVDALGGVPMHLDQPIDDEKAQLKLPAGDVVLNGEQALGFVRARKSLGDGSDIQRIERQQQFLKNMLAKAQDTGLLTDPKKLFNVMEAVTKSITTDPGLASLMSLYDFASGLRGIPEDAVEFITVPLAPYRPDPNRVALKQPDGGQLFARLRDEAVTPPTTPEPTLTGG